MREIHLYADYAWWPVWEYCEEDGHTYKEDFDPTNLPISVELAQQLNDWADAYDKTLDQSYPPDSGFPTQEDALEFAERGVELGKKLQDELGPEFKVIVDFTADDFAEYVRK